VAALPFWWLQLQALSEQMRCESSGRVMVIVIIVSNATLAYSVSGCLNDGVSGQALAAL